MILSFKYGLCYFLPAFTSFAQIIQLMSVSMGFPVLTEGLPSENLSHVAEMLSSATIDVQFLRKHLRLDIFAGAPLLREYVWKVVLGYLPSERSRWQEEAAKLQAYYSGFLEQFLGEGREGEYEADCSLWVRIEKDTYRTQPEMPYFKEPAEPLKPSLPSLWHESQGENTARRYHYMTRVLFIFARLNPRVEYVQGMNELLAPIFYVVNHSGAIQEAACFFMFTNVMTDIIDFHIRDYDNSENVFQERMARIYGMLAVVDAETWERLEELEIDPFLYLFRWVTLLFAQEFPMLQTLRIWEAIFSYRDRKPFVDAFSLALLVASRESIARGSFSEVLQHLRSISMKIDLEAVIIEARQYCESEPERWKETVLEEKEEREEWMPGFFKVFMS